MDAMQQKLEALEARIKELEDRQALFQMLSSYGPGVDSHSNKQVTDLWLEGGTYDLHDHVMTAPDDITEELDGEWHQGLLTKGSAHIMSLPHIQIDGDQAVLTCYSRLYRCEGDVFHVLSCSANRWEMVRDNGTWRVKNRVSRRLNGSEESKEILARGIGNAPA